MSKAGQRRLRKKSQALRELASKDPEGFHRVWGYLVECWAEEARQRGRCLRYQEKAVQPQGKVFGVLEHAVELLSLCGEEVERIVGPQTRQHLTDECVRAFSLAVVPHMYLLSIDQRYCRAREKGRRFAP